MPNDTTLHEFLALVLFAQGNYEQAAAPLYAVLSVGPGLGLDHADRDYSDARLYTEQLRSLEAFVKANPKSAQARSCSPTTTSAQGHGEAAVDQLKQVVALQPDDTLSAQLLAQLQPSGGTPPAPAGAAPAARGRRGQAGREVGGHAGQGREDRPGDPGRRRFRARIPGAPGMGAFPMGHPRLKAWPWPASGPGLEFVATAGRPGEVRPTRPD